MTRFLAFLCGALFVAAPALVATSPALAQAALKFGPWGVDLTSMDPSVKAGDNFFPDLSEDFFAPTAPRPAPSRICRS